MFFDLGLRTADYHKPAIVKDAILDIDEKFTVVLIYEYLDESLVLLKRKLCWELDDVLYLKTLLTKDISTRKYTTSEMDSLQKWSKADFLLYDHFNATLWKTISYEKEFFEELKSFRAKQTEIELDCLKYSYVTQSRNFEFSDTNLQNLGLSNGFYPNIELRNTNTRVEPSQNLEPSNGMSRNIASQDTPSRTADPYYRSSRQFGSRSLMSYIDIPSRNVQSRIASDKDIIPVEIPPRKVLSRSVVSRDSGSSVHRMNQYYCHKMRISTPGYLEYFRTKYTNNKH